MISLPLCWYINLEVWLFFVAPHFLWQAIQKKRVSTLRKLENYQPPVYAPFIDCVDRLRDAYVLIISGGRHYRTDASSIARHRASDCLRRSVDEVCTPSRDYQI